MIAEFPYKLIVSAFARRSNIKRIINKWKNKDKSKKSKCESNMFRYFVIDEKPKDSLYIFQFLNTV